jgi:hypothetical protein
MLVPAVAAVVDKGTIAKALLVELLTGQDRLASEVLAEAARRNIGDSNVRAAKRALNVRHYNLPAEPGQKGHGPSMWTLGASGLRSMTDPSGPATDLKAERPKRRKRRPEPPAH